MKLLRYGPIGQEKPGAMDSEGRVHDLSTHIEDFGGSALLPSSLDRLRRLDIENLPLVQGSPRLGACVAKVGKIICIGLNYSDHAAEANLPLPEEPIVFLKSTSAIGGPNDDIEIPPEAHKVDWEVELGIVIGKPGRYLSKETALDHVAGYCIVNDISERSYQLERGGQWDKGKGCDTFAPIGPWLVTAEDVPDPQALAMWLDVDEKRFQTGTTRNMIFDVATIIAYISRFMSLQSGDVIATGTPPGVGMGQKPAPVYLRGGQTMRLGIEGLGEQCQRAVQTELS